MPTSLKQDVQRLRRLKVDKDAKNAAFKKADQEFKEHQRRVYERFEAEEVEGIKHAGTNFVPTSTAYASIQDRDEFLKWALKNDKSLIVEKEAEGLLNQLVREKIDNGEPLPPGVSFYTRDVIAQRAA